MDSFLGDLSYCLHLLIGFDDVKVDHGGRLTAMGSVWAMVVVESDPAPDASPCLRPGFPSVQIDAFILQGPPETLDEPKVREANMLSRQRPLPSIEVRAPTRFRRSVQAKDVNWLPWSVFMISGGPNL